MADKPRKHLYEVAVLHHDKDGTTEVVKPKSILATTTEVARLAVVREIPEEYAEKLDDLEVLVRPFRC